MVNTITIRAFASRDWETYRGLRLAALTDSPDAFGRTLTKEQERSDAEWSSRLAAGVGSDLDLPLVAEIDGQPIGLAWGRIETSDLDVANLYQMWVAPTYRRRGVGRMLLETVTSWAQSKNACYLELGVTYRDSPAMRLYRRAGFEPVGEPRRLRQGSDLLGQTMRLELKGRAV